MKYIHTTFWLTVTTYRKGNNYPLVTTGFCPTSRKIKITKQKD